MKILSLIFLALAATCSANDIRVLVWDEQQPQQKEAYGEKFPGETLAAHLKKQPGLSVKTARLDDAEQGLSDAALDATDALIIWCHRRVKEQDDARAEAVVKCVLDDRLSLIALHSAHWAKPFVRLMQERAKADAIQALPESERAAAKWEFLNDAPHYIGVKANARLTPFVEKGEGNLWKLTLPQCVFPAYRADGAPGHLTTLLPQHPIRCRIARTMGNPADGDVWRAFPCAAARRCGLRGKVGQGRAPPQRLRVARGQGACLLLPARSRDVSGLQASRTAARH